MVLFAFARDPSIGILFLVLSQGISLGKDLGVCMGLGGPMNFIHPQYLVKSSEILVINIYFTMHIQHHANNWRIKCICSKL